MNLSSDDRLLAKLALHYELVTKQQLAEARRALDDSSEGTLATVLVEQGALSEPELARLERARAEYLKKTASRERQQGVAHSTQSSVPETAPAAPSVVTDTPTARTGHRKLDFLLDYALRQGASDIHVHSGAKIRVRTGGDLAVLGEEEVTAEQAEQVIFELLDDEQRQTLEEWGEVDFAHALPGYGRLRANVYRQQRGLDIVFRAIPPEPPTLEELNLPPEFERFTEYHQGVVLVTGPSSCGKSSTMAALTDLVNRNRHGHIITIEDPIEYVYESKGCLVRQRQIGKHSKSFAVALKAALREDPDVIVLGELRDLETISLALSAAETGHLVFGTLHTSTAIRTINRLLGVFPASQQDQIRTQMAESLRAIVSQRLLPRADGDGMIPALEVLIVTRAAANLIREEKTFQLQSVLQTGAAQGMQSLDGSLAELLRRGTITREQALIHCEKPERLEEAS